MYKDKPIFWSCVINIDDDIPLIMAIVELHRFFPSIFAWYFFLFPIISSFTAWTNSTYHITYYFKSEMHSHQLFNKFFLLFSFVDNIFITVMNLWIIIPLFFINIFVIIELKILYRIFIIVLWSLCKIITIMISNGTFSFFF